MTSYNIQEKNNMSSIKDEKDEMSGAIKYITFSGGYNKFDGRKEKTKEIFGHKDIIKYLTKEVDIPTKYEA